MENIYLDVEEMSKDYKDILFVIGSLDDLIKLGLAEGESSATEKGLIAYQILRDSNYTISKKDYLNIIKVLLEDHEPAKAFLDVLYDMTRLGKEKIQSKIDDLLIKSPEFKEVHDEWEKRKKE